MIEINLTSKPVYAFIHSFTLSLIIKSEVTQSCPTLSNPRTVAYQAPLSMGFSRQEYWSRLPSPSPGDLPNPGLEPTFPTLSGRFFTTEPPGNKPVLKEQ